MEPALPPDGWRGQADEGGQAREEVGGPRRRLEWLPSPLAPARSMHGRLRVSSSIRAAANYSAR